MDTVMKWSRFGSASGAATSNAIYAAPVVCLRRGRCVSWGHPSWGMRLGWSRPRFLSCFFRRLLAFGFMLRATWFFLLWFACLGCRVLFSTFLTDTRGAVGLVAGCRRPRWPLASAGITAIARLFGDTAAIRSSWPSLLTVLLLCLCVFWFLSCRTRRCFVASFSSSRCCFAEPGALGTLDASGTGHTLATSAPCAAASSLLQAYWQVVNGLDGPDTGSIGQGTECIIVEQRLAVGLTGKCLPRSEAEDAWQYICQTVHDPTQCRPRAGCQSVICSVFFFVQRSSKGDVLSPLARRVPVSLRRDENAFMTLARSECSDRESLECRSRSEDASGEWHGTADGRDVTALLPVSCFLESPNTCSRPRHLE